MSHCSPKGAGVVDAMAFPNGVRRARHRRLTPGTPVCRTHTAAVLQSTVRARSPPSQPRTPTAGRPVPFLVACGWVAHPTDPPRPTVGVYSRPSVPPGRNGSRRARTPRAKSHPTALPPQGPIPAGLGTLTLERADE